MPSVACTMGGIFAIVGDAPGVGAWDVVVVVEGEEGCRPRGRRDGSM